MAAKTPPYLHVCSPSTPTSRSVVLGTLDQGRGIRVRDCDKQVLSLVLDIIRCLPKLHGCHCLWLLVFFAFSPFLSPFLNKFFLSTTSKTNETSFSAAHI